MQPVKDKSTQLSGRERFLENNYSILNVLVLSLKDSYNNFQRKIWVLS